MFSFTHSTDNCTVAATRLLQLLNVRITAATVEKTIKGHPYYPSLLSIADSLNRWNLNAVAVKLKPGRLIEIPAPFIIHLKTKGGQFITIKSVTKDKITYLNHDRKEKYFTPEEFLQQWDGVVLLAEADKNSGEPGYKKLRQKEWWNTAQVPAGLVILFILGLIRVLKYSVSGYSGSLYYTALTFFSFLGVLITGLLLWHEYDHNNPLLESVCSAGYHSRHTKGHTGCQAILGSKASKAIGNITWSEIGFIYFMGSYLYLLMAGISSLPLLMILNILALPYIVFSIYYQARIAKQWCVLCLGVQSLLLLEFLTALITNQLAIQQFHNLSFETFILSFFLPAFIWFFSRPYLYAAKEGKQFRFQLARFKNIEDIFSALLQKQPALQQSTDGLGITIGHPEAKNTLIKVCNPYCGPCAKAHPKIEQLIHHNTNWKAQIIFTATGEEKDMRTAPTAHLMAIAAQCDTVKTQLALDDWYNAAVKSYDTFAKKYPMNGEIVLQKEKLQAMAQWCKEVKITGTPTYFVKRASSNGKAGYKLPGQYGVEDLMYLM